jgi:predicted  nucleic acid-binding Zn-ribbon protein
VDQETVEEIKRHFGVIAERLEGRIQLLAEGHEVLRRGFQEFREEVRVEFQEVKAMIRFSYAELDRRVRGLEQEIGDLRSRVERIEAVMDR